MNCMKLAGLVVAMGVLASCGGGGDVAGDVDEFSVAPPKVKFGVLTCATKDTYGYETLFTIVGGTPPYRIHNSWPDSLSVDRVEVSGKDPVFKVTTLDGCMDPGVITVLDYHSRTVKVEISVVIAK